MNTLKRWLDFAAWLVFGRALKASLLALPCVPIQVRALAYRLPVRVRIMPRTYVSGHNLTIGDRSFVNTGCFLEAIGRLEIGTHVHLASGVQILTTTHAIGGSSRRGGERRILSTSIGDGCWLGANVVVLPGVTVGRGCVIAAGAVVTRDCGPNGVYAGVPAERKRELGE